MYILLYVFWLLLCGKLTLEILLTGIVVVAAMAVFENRLFGYTPRTEARVIKKAPVFIAYIAVLAWEVLKAGLTVSRDILFKRYRVTPTLVTFKTDLKTEFGRFLLANSITLTPGTITIRVEENELTVHCLDGAMLDTSEDGVFQRWIRKLEA